MSQPGNSCGKTLKQKRRKKRIEMARLRHKSDPKTQAGNKSLIYLTAPCAEDNLALRKKQYMQAVQAQTQLLNSGVPIVFPVLSVYAAYMANENFKRYHYVWHEISHPLLHQCANMAVLMLPGWKTDSFIQSEILYATNNNIKIRYLLMEDFNDNNQLRKH
ncbi:DUF1937 family protein [Candidatus Parcubacteria bacterium]|nr:MAG: DUF1937 family protein [Candidatus Parcubacteria bacterium]